MRRTLTTTSPCVLYAAADELADFGQAQARLTIRMNTVSWNGGWAPLYAYLMPLYYPATGEAVPNLPKRV